MKSILTLAVLSLSFSAFSAVSDTLLLKGQVQQRLSIDVAAETIAANLPLDINQTDLKVATVTERSNSKSGYKVSISSANSGVLAHADGSETFDYTLKYDGVTLDLSNQVEQTYVRGSYNDEKDVTISYIGIPEEDMVEGIYSDVITFSISAN